MRSGIEVFPRLSVAAIALIGLSLVAGCSSSSEDEAKVQLSDLFASTDQQRSVAECLRDRGWESEYDADQSVILTEITEEQTAQYEMDTSECYELSGFSPDGTMGEDQYRVTFDWYSEIAECLESEGYRVPDQPTFQTFMSTYDTEPWIPWIDVQGENLGQARKACPVLNIPR